MIVWLNTDGSVGEIVSSYVLTDSDGNTYSAFSQREGNLAAGGIFVYFEGGNPSGGLAYSAWTLPTGEVSPTALKASWKKDCTIGLDKSRDMRKFKAEKAYEMQYFPFPDGLISEGGNGVYKVGITDSVDNKTYAYGPVLFSVAENSVVKETTLTKTEYAELKADVESKADKSVLEADYQLQYSSTNVRGYGNGVVTAKDLQSLADGQLIFMPPTSMEGDKRQELWYVTKTDGVNNAEKAPVAVEGNRPYFVYTKENYSPSKEVQNVGTGLVSYFYDENNKERVVYGTDNVTDGYGFFVNVLDASGNYSGAISLGAKTYKFAYDNLVDVFSSDGNTTAIKSPMGSASVELANGDSKVYGTNVYIGSKDAESSGYTGTIKIGNSITLESGGAVINLSPVGSMNIRGTGLNVYCMTTFNDVAPRCYVAPDGDECLTNKSYVDSTAEAQATEKANALQVTLQAEIDAINASQNFVATYGKKADLPTAPSGILENDCVLILQDEEHDNASTVYKWTGSAWEFVGKLGDCYTKAEIDAEHNEIKSEISVVNTKYASMFTATSSKTAESE
jgi:hypothetical protein